MFYVVVPSRNDAHDDYMEDEAKFEKLLGKCYESFLNLFYSIAD